MAAKPRTTVPDRPPAAGYSPYDKTSDSASSTSAWRSIA